MYYLKCKYKEQVLLPYIAVTDNVNFLCDKSKEIRCMTADGVPCVATYCKEINILSENAEQLVKKLYNVDVFGYLCKWYAYDKNLSSLMFLELYLRKGNESEQTKEEE